MIRCISDLLGCSTDRIRLQSSGILGKVFGGVMDVTRKALLVVQEEFGGPLLGILGAAGFEARYGHLFYPQEPREEKLREVYSSRTESSTMVEGGDCSL